MDKKSSMTMPIAIKRLDNKEPHFSNISPDEFSPPRGFKRLNNTPESPKKLSVTQDTTRSFSQSPRVDYSPLFTWNNMMTPDTKDYIRMFGGITPPSSSTFKLNKRETVLPLVSNSGEKASYTTSMNILTMCDAIEPTILPSI